MLFPKPEKRRTTKARRRREEAAVVQDTREKVAQRDGHCRLAGVKLFGSCCPLPPEWAHFGGWRRWQTRGLPPEERHRDDRSMMLCRWHHDAYDAHRLLVTALTERGTNGPLRFESGGTVYEEPAAA